jgi:hypothetical protein
VVDSAGEMTAREAIITNGIRIPASVFTATYGTNGKGGKERSIPAAHAIVIA